MIARWLMAGSVAGLLLLAGGRLSAQEAAPVAPTAALNLYSPTRPVPGLPAEDLQPNGCVDCHAQQGDHDLRLSTLIGALGMGAPEELMAKARAATPAGAELSGWHPALKPEAFSNIPGACLRCHHEESSRAPRFAGLMHAIHLGHEAPNPFVEKAGGSCGSCHKPDPATGGWRLPSGAEK